MPNDLTAESTNDLKAADEALYREKKASRDRIFVYDPIESSSK